MLKVGITGQNGFVGTHLYLTLGLQPDKFERISFNRSFFDSEVLLDSFVSSCDVVVHLAGLNRHSDPNEIYATNVLLAQKLISACERTGSTPHIIFSSSTQEERDNLYGRSKLEARKLFETWANSNSALFSGLIIPNVFGPFGSPFYNSVVSTFCYQLAHDQTPKIETDVELRLIYVGELVEVILEKITGSFNRKKERKDEVHYFVQNSLVPHTETIQVSSLLEKLQQFKGNYFERGQIPDLTSSFDRDLWNTFLCYIDHNSFFPFQLTQYEDNRGTFVEIVRLSSGGQVSFSTTVPGITRGNHFHTRKAERFAVIKGKAKIDLRRIGTDTILSFFLEGDNPSFVDMPIWFAHNITNIGEDDLYTIFWINERFDPSNPDTYPEKV